MSETTTTSKSPATVYFSTNFRWERYLFHSYVGLICYHVSYGLITI